MTDIEALYWSHRDNPDEDTVALVYADALDELGRNDESATIRQEVRVRQAARRIAPGKPYHLLSLTSWLAAPETACVLTELLEMRQRFEKGKSASFGSGCRIFAHPKTCRKFLRVYQLKDFVRSSYGKPLRRMGQVNIVLSRLCLPIISGDKRIEEGYGVWVGNKR